MILSWESCKAQFKIQIIRRKTIWIVKLNDTRPYNANSFMLCCSKRLFRAHCFPMFEFCENNATFYCVFSHAFLCKIVAEFRCDEAWTIWNSQPALDYVWYSKPVLELVVIQNSVANRSRIGILCISLRLGTAVEICYCWDIFKGRTLITVSATTLVTAWEWFPPQSCVLR